MTKRAFHLHEKLRAISFFDVEIYTKVFVNYLVKRYERETTCEIFLEVIKLKINRAKKNSL